MIQAIIKADKTRLHEPKKNLRVSSTVGAICKGHDGAGNRGFNDAGVVIKFLSRSKWIKNE